MTSRPGRILIVEDEERWREALLDVLAEGGFEADTAATRTEAVAMLASHSYHLMVLDLRMDDQDPSNVEGMDLLRMLGRYGISDAPRVIVLSAYATYERMREAFAEYGVVDFLLKQDYDEEAFLARVRQIFDHEIRVNRNLEIHWQDPLSPEQAVVHLLVGGSRVKRNTDQQALLAGELDDLLCRLFHNAESVVVRPLGSGMSGAKVVWVQPFYPAGAGRAVVVKVGAVDLIDLEASNFKEFVEPYVGGRRSTSIRERRRTARLGGIVYSLLDETADGAEDFEAFYRRSELPEIGRTLEALFLDTCGPWYANPGRLQPIDLGEHYRTILALDPRAIEAGRGELQKVQGKDKLHFQSLTDGGRAFLNPLTVLSTGKLRLTTYEAITHGDFNEHNILLDRQGNPWLIDFQRTGRGHVLRDLIQLDAVVRLRLLEPEEATLDERLRMEEILCRGERFPRAGEPDGVPPEIANPAVAKALATCLLLRRLAGRIVANNPNADQREYLAGALYYALNLLTRFSSVRTLQREHALLSASLIAERLQL